MLAALRILLVEDDEMLGDAVREALCQEGYVIDWVRAAGAALAALSTSNFSALVLDLACQMATDSASCAGCVRTDAQRRLSS